MNDCIFCRIVRGEVPSTKVFENEKFLAILDIGPIAFGHTLVLPRQHVELFTDLSEELARDLAVLTQRIARAVVAGTGAEGFNLLSNNKRCAGQAIPHVHVHIIPRRSDDGVKYQWNPKQYPEGEMARYAEQIKKALS